MSKRITIHDLIKSDEEKAKSAKELEAIFAKIEKDAEDRKKTLREEIERFKKMNGEGDIGRQKGNS